MRNLWVRIGLTAGAIFGVGMLLVLGVRAGKAKIHDVFESDADIRIPLLGIIPFQLGPTRLGDLRRLTLMRDSPDHLTGVRVDVRLGDSATLDVLKDCRFLTVGDPLHVNEHTQFSCVSDTAGFTRFGLVEIQHRQGGEPTTLERTLVFPPEVMRQIETEMHSGRGDSSRAADMQRWADSLEAMGDSIRAATRVQVDQARRGAGHGTSVRVQVRDIPPPAPTAPARPTP